MSIILHISSLLSEWSQKEQFISHGLLILIVNTISVKMRTRSSGTMTRYTCIWEECPERHLNIDKMINDCYHFREHSEWWQKPTLFEIFFQRIICLYIPLYQRKICLKFAVLKTYLHAINFIKYTAEWLIWAYCILHIMISILNITCQICLKWQYIK